MSKFRITRSKFSRFVSSKGLYAAIAACVVGTGLAAWTAIDRTISGIQDSNSKIISSSVPSFKEFPILEEVERNQPDIPKVVSVPPSSSSKPASSSAPSSKPEENSPSAQESPTSSGSFYSLPVNGDIINQFSNGELVKNTTLNDWRTHDGIDIAAAKGDSVYAVTDGTVTEIRKDSLWGTIIVIDHADGKQSIYSGLAEIVPVKIGEVVLAKQVIGSVDGIPCEMSDDFHLHFGMKENGSWIDPLSVVAK